MGQLHITANDVALAYEALRRHLGQPYYCVFPLSGDLTESRQYADCVRLAAVLNTHGWGLKDYLLTHVTGRRIPPLRELSSKRKQQAYTWGLLERKR